MHHFLLQTLRLLLLYIFVLQYENVHFVDEDPIEGNPQQSQTQYQHPHIPVVKIVTERVHDTGEPAANHSDEVGPRHQVLLKRLHYNEPDSPQSVEYCEGNRPPGHSYIDRLHGAVRDGVWKVCLELVTDPLSDRYTNEPVRPGDEEVVDEKEPGLFVEVLDMDDSGEEFLNEIIPLPLPLYVLLRRGFDFFKILQGGNREDFGPENEDHEHRE